MVKEVPEKCLLLFNDVNCIKCREVEHFLESIQLPLPLIVLNEATGKTLAKKFSIKAVPVLIVIDNYEEYTRFYGSNYFDELMEVFEELNLGE